MDRPLRRHTVARLPFETLDAARRNARIFLELTEGIARGDHPDPEQVHDTRVSGRRLQATLRVLGPALPPEAADLAAAVKQSIRALGALRDGDILSVMFVPFLQTHPSAVGEILALLGRRREKLRKRARSQIRKALTSETRRSIGALFERDDSGAWPAVAIGSAVARVRAAGLATLRAWQALLRATGPDAQIPEWHRVRIAGKAVRYTVEILAGDGGGADDLVAAWKALQDELGVMNDRHVAAAWLEAHADPGSRHPLPERECRILAAHLVRTADVMRQTLAGTWPPARLAELKARTEAYLQTRI